jgi:hypothetical protein
MPLCKLGHDDEERIEGRYKVGSYFIKCEQCEIEITHYFIIWHYCIGTWWIDIQGRLFRSINCNMINKAAKAH